MSTILLILAVAVLIIVIIARIPGLEHFVRPTIDLLFTGLKLSIEHGWAWIFFLFKSLWFAHLELIRHAVLPEDVLDPAHKVKESAEV